MESRIAAREQADAILLNYPDMPKADAARMRTVLVEVIMFELPVRQMQIAVNDFGHVYNIIIQGYRNVIDDVKWVNTFFGTSRHDDLASIVDSQTLFADNAKILKMEKVRFVTSESVPVPHKRRFTKRTGD